MVPAEALVNPAVTDSEVDGAGHFAFHIPGDDSGQILLRRVGQGAQRTHVESEASRLGNRIEPAILSEYFSRQEDIHLTHSRPRGEHLHIVVYELSPAAPEHRIQTHPFADYGRLDIFPPLHLLHRLQPPVPVQQELPGIVFRGLPGSDPETACETFVGDIAGIVPEGIKRGDVPGDEDFEVSHVDELQAVGDYAGQEAPVLLIAAQLAFPVVLPCDYYAVQHPFLAHHFQPRIQTHLPFGIPHVLRDRHLELQPYDPVPLRDVPEPRRDHCGVYPVKGHHLSRGLVLARPHYQDFLAVRPSHLHGIAPRGDQVDVGLRQGVLRLRRQPEPGSDAFFRNSGNLHLKSARRKRT